MQSPPPDTKNCKAHSITDPCFATCAVTSVVGRPVLSHAAGAGALRADVPHKLAEAYQGRVEFTAPRLQQQDEALPVGQSDTAVSTQRRDLFSTDGARTNQIPNEGFLAMKTADAIPPNHEN